jgi:hypothetical protein
MRSVPQTKFSAPKIDSNETILQASLKGDLTGGGFINSDE